VRQPDQHEAVHTYVGGAAVDQRDGMRK
jgi:hypothetical protein